MFSDKTGTLTQNEMILAKWSIGGERFVEDESPPLRRDDLSKEQRVRITDFMRAMALCNTAVPSINEAGGL